MKAPIIISTVCCNIDIEEVKNRVAKGWKISGKFPWEVKMGNFGNIPNWKLSMGIKGIMGIYGN